MLRCCEAMLSACGGALTEETIEAWLTGFQRALPLTHTEHALLLPAMKAAIVCSLASLLGEEQPEDAFLTQKRPEPEEKKSAPPAAPPASEAPAEGGEQFWKELCGRVVPRLPIDMRIYPGDGSKFRGRLKGGVLTLEAESGFVYNRFNRSEILKKFSDCAAELTGRPVNTVLRELSETARETRSLDELKAFPETRVIG